MSRKRASDRTPCASLRSWSELAPSVREGIRAIPASHKVLFGEPRRYRCAVNLDEARRQAEPNAPRWDYLLATDDELLGVEVHPAKASEVVTVVRKMEWAKAVVRKHCDTNVRRWHWLRPPSSPLQFTATSPQARRLAMSGIEFPKARL